MAATLRQYTTDAAIGQWRMVPAAILNAVPEGAYDL